MHPLAWVYLDHGLWTLYLFYWGKRGDTYVRNSRIFLAVVQTENPHVAMFMLSAHQTSRTCIYLLAATHYMWPWSLQYFLLWTWSMCTYIYSFLIGYSLSHGNISTLWLLAVSVHWAITIVSILECTPSSPLLHSHTRLRPRPTVSESVLCPFSHYLKRKFIHSLSFYY